MTTRTFAANAAALPAETTTDRHTMLATAGAAAVLAAMGTPAAALPVVPFVGVLKLRPRWLEIRASMEVQGLSDDAFDERVAAEVDMLEELANHSARTLAELAFKAEACAADDNGCPELVASIMADVAAFAAAHPQVPL